MPKVISCCFPYWRGPLSFVAARVFLNLWDHLMNKALLYHINGRLLRDLAEIPTEERAYFFQVVLFERVKRGDIGGRGHGLRDVFRPSLPSCSPSRHGIFLRYHRLAHPLLSPNIFRSSSPRTSSSKCKPRSTCPCTCILL